MDSKDKPEIYNRVTFAALERQNRVLRENNVKLLEKIDDLEDELSAIKILVKTSLDLLKMV